MRSALASLLVLLAAGGCARAPSATGGASVAAPDFALPDLSGRTVRLVDFRGKVVLLDFWATDCGPCEMTVPFLRSLRLKDKARGFEVVGVSIDGDPAAVVPYVSSHRMEYPVLLDSDRRVMETYGVAGIPATFLVDRDGNVIQEWRGINEDIPGEIEAAVEGLLSVKAS